jgi:hypothetical protein
MRVEGARLRLKLVYGNTQTTVHSTKQRKGRGPSRDPGPLLVRFLFSEGETDYLGT